MRTIELDTLADRLLAKGHATELTSEHVTRLRDAILWETTLEILGALGSWAFTPDRLREQHGDGLNMRRAFEPTDIYRDDVLHALTTAVIREGTELMPTAYVRRTIEGTLQVAELVRRVSGADDDYTAPEELLTLLCAVTGLALRRPPSVHRESGKAIVQRAFDNANNLSLSLPRL